MHADPTEPRDHGGKVVAPIEAIFELGECSACVFVRAAIGAGDRTLDIAECGIDPPELRQFLGMSELADDQALVRNPTAS